MQESLHLPMIPHKDSLEWIDSEAIKDALVTYREVPPTEDGDRRRLSLLKFIFESRGLWSRYVKSASLNAVLALNQRHPHFEDVIMYVVAQLAMIGSAGAKPRQITPILLLGDPGIGKTRFAHDLAKIMGVTFKAIPMNSLSAGFALAGLDRAWSGSKPGQVFDLLLEADCINPVILLDEIDKAAEGGNSPPLGPMYQLLEPYTASSMKDEFVQIPIRAQYITWIATANKLNGIPEPLLSRMKIFDVHPPSKDQMRIIVSSMLDELREDIPSLSRKMDEPVWRTLCALSPREARATLNASASFAALRARMERASQFQIQMEDFSQFKAQKKMPIGFYP